MGVFIYVQRNWNSELRSAIGLLTTQVIANWKIFETAHP
jgi:hypothetical protein